MTRDKPDSVKAGVKADGAHRPRQRLAPDARREQIIREATRLISRSGFNAVSLGDVADACGIRKPSVLHYFPSMNELLATVLARREEGDFFRAEIMALEPMSADTARDLFTRIVARNLDQREFVQLFAVLRAEALDPRHPAHEYFRRRFARAHEIAAKMLAWRADPVSSAVEVLAVWEGLELAWLQDPSVDLLKFWEEFADRFFVT